MPDRPVLGLLVNPIAGMGGPVALKGTDDAADEARSRGAEPVSPERALRFLRELETDIEVVTCSGPMGEEVCRRAGREARVLVEVEEPTHAEDTRRAACRFVDEDVDLLCFVGGDGTAVDVAQAIGHAVVCLGVPGGVKMNSAVFAETPELAAGVVDDVLAGRVDTHAVDIVEVDEGSLRQGDVDRAEMGSLLVPEHERVQPSKAAPGGGLEPLVEAGRELAVPGSRLVVGPGSTMHAVKEALVGTGTLLGVDVLSVDAEGRARVEIEDAQAEDLEEVDEALILVSPIGGQGFVFGRGNQQLVPDLLARLGWGSVRVLATPAKLRDVDRLRADTGDPALDRAGPRFLDVVTGPGFRTRVRLSTDERTAGR